MLLLAFLLPLPRVQAATITVDSDCSLANAIRSANGDSQTGAQNSCESGDTGADTISLGQNVTLSAALPEITSTVTVEGNGRFISGANSYRIFNVPSSGNLTLDNITLRNGNSSGDTTEPDGGAVVAIGDMTIRDSLFRDNRGVNGGAIVSEGSLTITNSRFTGNQSTENGGAILIRGAFAGLNVTGSLFSSNRADNSGGAIYSGTASTVRNSAFISNRGTIADANNVQGGGAYYALNSRQTLENLSFHGNSVAYGAGGAIFQNTVSRLEMSHVTISGNRAPTGGGLRLLDPTRHSFVNSVIAGNSGGDCSILSGSLAANQVTNFWIQDGTCSATFSGDPQLASPRGALPVAPPVIGSGLVDAAPDDANCLDTDIRGVERPVGAACDIGAYEGAVAREIIAQARDDGPYIPPTPAGPTCQVSLNDAVSIRGHLPGSECQLVSGAGIGNEDVIKAKPIAAVDVWSYIGPGLTVCFRGQGKVVLLDAATSPRTLLSLSSFFADGQTCAFLDRVGTVVLLPADSALAPPSANIATRSTPASRSLSDCMVTATHDLNFRGEPGGPVIGYVRRGWRLTAAARTEDWFQVDRNGAAGWISADYVKTEGSCG